MAGNVDVRKMIERFRVAELNSLLSFARKVKTGPKRVLQETAFGLLADPSEALVQKIVSLYEAYKLERAKGPKWARTSKFTSGLPGTNANANNVPPQGPSCSIGAPPQGIPNALVPAGQVECTNGARAAPTPTANPVILKTLKFTEIPFYDLLEEILKPTLISSPTCATQRNCFRFSLNDRRVNEILSSRGPATNTMQVQLRFSLLGKVENSNEYFPHCTAVRVNDQEVPLPPTLPTHRKSELPKRRLVPLDITNYLKLAPYAVNTMTIAHRSDERSVYAMRLALVRLVDATQLLDRLVERGWLNAEYTQALILKAIRDGSGDIIATSLTISLRCPIAKTRMNFPCRAYSCLHVQCFDAISYLEMNKIRAKWTCPLCLQPAPFNTLLLDGFIKKILNTPDGQTADKVVFNNRCLWTVQGKNDGNDNRNGTSSAIGPNTIHEILDDEEETRKTAEKVTDAKYVHNCNGFSHSVDVSRTTTLQVEEGS